MTVAGSVNAEVLLGAGESWFKTLVETTSTGIFVFRDRLLYVNPACSELTGYSGRELLALKLSDLIPERYRSPAERAVRRLLAGDGEEAGIHEIPVLCKDGDRRHLQIRTAHVELAGSVALVGTATDVTEQRQTEKALRESEQWFRTLAETTTTAIFVYEADRVSYVNRAAEELTGYDARELVNLGPLDLVHPEHADRVRRRIARRLKGESVDGPRIELKILTKDGQERWLDIAAAPLDVGDRPAVLGTAIDVTERKQAELALKESEERYRQMFEKNRAVKLLIDPQDGRIVDATPSAAEFYGYSRDELRQLQVFDLNTMPREDAVQRLREAQQKERNHFKFRHRLASGEIRVVEVFSSPVDIQGRSLLFAIIHDVTEQQEAQEALQRERERAQVTLASIGDGVIRTDADGRIDYLNPVAERLTGWSSESAAGEPLGRVFRVVDELTRKPLADPVDLCFRKRHVIELPDPALLLRRDGQEFAVRDTVAPILDVDGKPSGAVLVFKDVTELRGMEREMAYLAHHDPLTGLLNRREFGRVVEASLETVRPGKRTHALLHFDLDGFKLINDTLGPVAGDELLRRIADLLAAHLKDGDAMARVGSDEFAVLLIDVSAEQARDRAEELRSGVENLRFPWQDRMVQLTTSIGLVLLADAQSEQSEVLKAADAACYVAKEQGRNRIHEYRPDDRAVAERSGEMQWIHRIHEAFETDRFCLFRQRIEPISDHGDRKCMYEIFIRMRGEGDSWIAPGAFIPAAEKYRLATRIDRWVVTHALDLLEADEATYTINLSGQSLAEESFLDEVVRSLEASGVCPGRVCFEITETAAIAHLTRALRFISVLRGLGCRFILDDFGSGLSSFAYLKNLTVDYLKIDREFVSEMQSGRVQRALVKSIHQIGHDMGIETIAEGIETEATYEAIKELGVDYGQGFWIGRPTPFGNA